MTTNKFRTADLPGEKHHAARGKIATNNLKLFAKKKLCQKFCRTIQNLIIIYFLKNTQVTSSKILLREAYIGPRNVMTLLRPTYLDAARAKPCICSRGSLKLVILNVQS